MKLSTSIIATTLLLGPASAYYSTGLDDGLRALVRRAVAEELGDRHLFARVGPDPSRMPDPTNPDLRETKGTFNFNNAAGERVGGCPVLVSGGADCSRSFIRADEGSHGFVLLHAAPPSDTSFLNKGMWLTVDAMTGDAAEVERYARARTVLVGPFSTCPRGAGPVSLASIQD